MLIKSVMLVALGFLSALLLALIFAPALWRRAVRLTTQRIRASMPMTMNEIQADKDRLRADFAIRIRKFEVALEREKMKTARQLVDISRRDSDIKTLESNIEGLERELEEQQNANRVYAQTISRRIPRMETQLERAKELLGARYNEIAKLRTTINKQENKLGEAQTMSQQRKAEVDRLRIALETNPTDAAEEVETTPQIELERAEARNRELEEEVAILRSAVQGDTSEEQASASENSSLAETEVGQVVKRLLSGFSVSDAPADNKADSEVVEANQASVSADDVSAATSDNQLPESEDRGDTASDDAVQVENVVSLATDRREDSNGFIPSETSNSTEANGISEGDEVSSEHEAVLAEAASVDTPYENGHSSETEYPAQENGSHSSNDLDGMERDSAIDAEGQEMPEMGAEEDTAPPQREQRSLHERLKEL